MRPHGYQSFPKFVFHADEPAGRIVEDQNAVDALGPGWVESPADLGAAPAAPDHDDGIAAYYALKANEAIKLVSTAPDADVLKELRTIEPHPPQYKGGRKTVLGAMDDRRAILRGATWERKTKTKA